jgi:hypothetical protein
MEEIANFFQEYWLLVIFLIIVFSYIIDKYNDYCFNEIKEIVGYKEADLTSSYTAINEINNVSKGTYTLIDSVDVKLDGYNYKLVKCVLHNCSGIESQRFSTSLYICSLDRTSSAVAKGMYNLLRLADESERASIFIVRNVRRLKNKIEEELQLY